MSDGLGPRAPLGPDETAALVAVASALLTSRPSIVDDPDPDPVPAWRFSGRWFNAGRFALRRPHD